MAASQLAGSDSSTQATTGTDTCAEAGDGVSACTRGNRLRLLKDGDELRPALLEAIGQAKSSIWVNLFELQDHPSSAEIVDALIAALERDVEVKLVVDNRKGSGTFNAAKADNPLLQELRAAGATVLMPRYAGYNHRKIWLFDGKLAFLPGQNVGPSYLLPRSAGWSYHDVALVLEGPAVRDVAEVYQRSWVGAGGSPLVMPPRSPELAGPFADARLRIYAHEHGGERNFERELVDRLDEAHRRVVLANGFSMTDEVQAAVRRAKQRGVEVVWLFGSAAPESTQMAADEMERLSNLGVEVLFHPDPMHLKIYVVDDFVYLGSSNLDGLSMWLNDEIVVRIELAEFREYVMRGVLDEDLARSTDAASGLPRATSAKDHFLRIVLDPLLSR